MKRKKEIQDELENISPFLASLKKEEGFTVPKNYFEQLQNDVLKQVQVTTDTPTPVAEKIHWSDRIASFFATLIQPRMAMGLATIALLFVAGIFLLKNNQTSNDSFIVSNDEAHNYLSDNIDDIDTDFFLEAGITDEDLDELSNIIYHDDDMNEYIDEIIDEVDDQLLEELL